MQFTMISASAAVLAFASIAQASSAIVDNQCGFPVYLWSVGDTSSEMFTIESNGTPYSEEYQTRASGGISLSFLLCTRIKILLRSSNTPWTVLLSGTMSQM